MTVLITGGGGFIAANIIRRLTARGVGVRVFDRRDDRGVTRAILGDDADGLDWRSGDVASAADVAAASNGCDFVIHLAALLTPACSDDPVFGAQVNLIGTLNVFQAARANGLRGVAYASSASVFGPDDGAVPFPLTHYGAYKLACEGAARAYWHESGLPSFGFRPLVVYGPGREVGLSAGPSIACREAVAGRPYTIPFSGATDMIFVDDVAAAFEAAATQDFTGAHALTLTGERADVEAIAATIRALVPGAEIDWDGPEIPITPDLVRGPVEDLLGPLPRTGLAEGLEKTVAHYRAAGA